MTETSREHVVIVGAGVGGLTAALALGRAGHEVTVLERDELAPLASAEEAFATERRGAPQVHQTHGFLARLQVILRDRFPDVLEEILAAGGTTMSMTTNLGDARPGDEDLKVIIIRRSTLEWVLRKAALVQDHVEIRAAAGVAGLVTSEHDGANNGDGPPRVTGVRLDDGTVVEGDAVIAATGRRGTVPDWLAAIGVDVPERVVESGLMYLTRWYHRPAADLPPDPKLGGDLGFVKYLAVPGDGDTLSVTLAVRTEDRALRTALNDPDRFDLACHLLPGPDLFFGGDAPPMEPIGGVRPMTGLLNRIRRFVDDAGTPTVLGFHAIGDAHTTTNPLYGRGCSLAAVQATMLADAFATHPGDHAARATTYEAGNAREIEPWFDSSIQMDRMGADPTGSKALGGSDGNDDAAKAQAKAMGAVFAAARTDPIIGRGIARFMNLLATPAQLMADAELLGRMAEVMADPDAWPPEKIDGPSRTELLEQLGTPSDTEREELSA